MSAKVIVYIGILCIALLVCPTRAATPPPAKTGEELSLREKAAIIQSAIELTLKSEGPSKFSQYVIFSSDGMSASLLPKIDGFRFQLMKSRDIKKRRQMNEGFRYLTVEYVKRGEVVSFNLYLTATSGGLPLYSHVYKYLFKKFGSEWQGELVTVICWGRPTRQEGSPTSNFSDSIDCEL